MRNWLPLCFAAAIVAAPAQAQYIYMDTDGDQQCTGVDFLPNEGGAVDVWLDTSKAEDGTPAACTTGEDLTVSAYEVIIAASGFAVTGWTNARPEFPQSLGYVAEGNLVRVAYTSSGASTHLPPGAYKLGTLTATPSQAQACLYLSIVGAAFLSGKGYRTGFYSQCTGPRGDNTVVLGADFFDACGLGGICDDAKDLGTTWGKIKEQYLGK